MIGPVAQLRASFFVEILLLGTDLFFQIEFSDLFLWCDREMNQPGIKTIDSGIIKNCWHLSKSIQIKPKNQRWRMLELLN